MPAIDPDDYQLRKLLEKIHAERGVDFSGFRNAYLARRVGTRLLATGANTIREYMRVLDSGERTDEYHELLDALTVNVTEFFRDKPVWRYVEKTLIPEMLDAKYRKGHEVIRVWSAGCSGGEETYSVTMLLLDAIAKHGARYQLHVVGTDIDRAMLAKAKDGRYPIDKLDQVPRALRDKYLDADETEFQMSGAVRSVAKFRRLDLFADNAIGAVDLILCRNVMIYFDRAKQATMFEKFVNALRKGGFLVIGKSEKLAPEIGAQLVTRDLRERVYQRPA